MFSLDVEDRSHLSEHHENRWQKKCELAIFVLIKLLKKTVFMLTRKSGKLRVKKEKKK